MQTKPTNFPLLFCVLLTCLSIWDTTSAVTTPDDQWTIFVALVVFGASWAYMLPSILAFKYNADLRWLVFGMNLVLGWTVIVWIVCFFSLNQQQKPQIIYIKER